MNSWSMTVQLIMWRHIADASMKSLCVVVDDIVADYPQGIFKILGTLNAYAVVFDCFMEAFNFAV